jgi:hypothetical protein
LEVLNESIFVDSCADCRRSGVLFAQQLDEEARKVSRYWGVKWASCLIILELRGVILVKEISNCETLQ